MEDNDFGEQCSSIFSTALASVVLSEFKNHDFKIIKWYEHPARQAIVIHLQEKRAFTQNLGYGLIFDYSKYLTFNGQHIYTNLFIKGLESFLQEEITKIKRNR